MSDAARLIVVAVPGTPIAVIAYGGAEALARVELEPLHALRIAGVLIDAASRRLAEPVRDGGGGMPVVAASGP